MTPKRNLPADLVALVHHIELAEAGWADRLAEQVVLTALYRATSLLGIDELSREATTAFQVPLPNGAVSASIGRLSRRDRVVEVGQGRYKLSEEHRAVIRQQLSEGAALEARARSRMMALIGDGLKDLGQADFWEPFCSDCLRPLLGELGARTYALISGASEDLNDSRSVATFLERFPEDSREVVASAIDRFLDPSEVDCRQFVLQRLHSSFLTLAANLSQSTLDSLTRRLSQTVQLKLLLDTNFLFSLLGLHDNPTNDVAADLVELIRALKGNVRCQFFVTPLTVDEAKRALGGYERRLTDMPLTPKLGRLAAQSDRPLSGIIRRFMVAAKNAKHRLSAKEYFAPYIHDTLTILRSKGIELYNDRVDAISTDQPVIDDILDQQQYEERRYGERAKSYEALRHDITLWHLVLRRREDGLQSPLDAVYWVVTHDYRVLGFDAYKR